MHLFLVWFGPMFASLYLFLANRLMGWAEEMIASAQAIRLRCDPN